MKKLGIISFIIIGIVVSLWFGIGIKNNNISINSFAQTAISSAPPTGILSTHATIVPSITPVPSVTPKPFNKSFEIPVTLKIPKINVRAKVESVGLDAKGNMDVPKEADNVGWYSLGYKPAEKGSAVMAGHLDKKSGEPAVFWDLKKIDLGDKLITTGKNGQEHTFSVVKKVQYPYNEFPLQEVFGSANQAMLNLITCEGNWDSKTKNYSHRTVIYAKLD